MPQLLSTDPVVFARDEQNNLIIPLRIARGLEAVAILARTRLLLWADEWFLDRSAGTRWLETEDGTVTERDAILGQPYDAGKIAREVRRVILGEPAIPGANDVTELKSSFDGATRSMELSLVIRCVFGDVPLTVSVPA